MSRCFVGGRIVGVMGFSPQRGRRENDGILLLQYKLKCGLCIGCRWLPLRRWSIPYNPELSCNAAASGFLLLDTASAPSGLIKLCFLTQQKCVICRIFRGARIKARKKRLAAPAQNPTLSVCFYMNKSCWSEVLRAFSVLLANLA